MRRKLKKKRFREKLNSVKKPQGLRNLSINLLVKVQMECIDICKVWSKTRG